MSRPWMPLYIADYRADTAHLSAAEHGAYLLLIMHYWQAECLPDEDRQLARIACMTPGEWKRARPTVEKFFAPAWRHKRIDAEIARAAEVSSKRRAAAEQRYCKGNAIAPANADANAEQLETHARTCASASQPQPHSEEETSSSSGTRKRAPPSQAAGTRLPAGWKPTLQGWSFAKDALGEERARQELEKFRDFWLAKPGAGGRKTDWDATWRNWIRRASETRAPPSIGQAPRPGSREDRQERLSNVLQSFDPRLRPDADDGGSGEGAAAPLARLISAGERH